MLFVSLVLITGCGGGGGDGSGGETEPDINEGSFSLNDFNYVNTHPVGYHPTGTDGYQVLAREELFTIIPGSDGSSRSHKMQEGPDAAYTEIAEVNDLFMGEGIVQSAAAGQLDQDPASELVVATLASGGTDLTIHLVNRLPSGQYERTPIQSIAAGAWSFADVRITLGDVDHDFRDEIIIVARSALFGVSSNNGQVWVFNDPQDGASEMMTYIRNGEHIDLHGLPIDADGDKRQEIVVGLSGDATDDGRYAVRLFDLAEGEQTMTEVHGWQYLHQINDQYDSRAVVGDFDADGRDDLAWVGYSDEQLVNPTISYRHYMSIKLFDFTPNNTWQAYASTAIYSSTNITGITTPNLQPGNWAVAVFHPEIRRAELAIAYPSGGGDYEYSALHFDRTQDHWSNRSSNINLYNSNQGIALAASDVDADGAEELQVALLHYGANSGTLNIGYLEHGTSVDLIWQNPITLGTGPVSNVSPVSVLAPGDYDADGLALQYTGVHSLKLDPIPLVVMSAPPTVAGISQNVNDTESAYQTGSSQGTSIGVSTYSSITKSDSAGFSLEGLFGVEARTSMEVAVERTETITERETIVQGYRGAYDADVIIFQGTLYETYEYMIVAAEDTTAVGSLITLDIPVDENIYKWTVDYYNQNVAAEDQIGSDLLTHTPGDLESYPTRNELAALMLGEMHWDLPGVHAVGQGGASNYQSVSFETENASEEQRTVTKSYGGGVTIGIRSLGIDKTDSEGETHGITYAFETVFEATIGDIDVPADYNNWRYNWGFSIHTVGRLADSSNQPVGYASRKHSFQYLRYWAEPTGAGY